MNTRQSIMTALQTQLETITKANGYNTDLGASVAEWRGYPTETGSMPILLMRDTEDKVANNYQYHDHDLSVELEVIASGNTVSTEMRKMLADIYDCVGANLSLGGYTYDIMYNGDTMTLVHEEQKIMAAVVSLTLRFKSRSFDSDKIYNV
jgi:hypothetical protein